MKRPLLWLSVILVIFLLILLWFWLFPSKDKQGSTNLAFPNSAGTPNVISPGIFAQNGNLKVSVVNEAPAPSYVTTKPASSQIPYSVPTYTPFSFPVQARGSQASGVAPVQQQIRVTMPRVIIPNIVPPTPPPYPQSYYIPPPPGTTGPVTVGRTRGGDDIIFDPITGDLRIGQDLHFNFGMGPVPNGATSDIVGDPENVTLGNTIGTLVGSLLGDPGMGLILGTALGSNLFNGFTLQDLGIGLEGGMLTLGGENILGSILNSSGLEGILGDSFGSITGGLGIGGNSYFGAIRAFTMVCTCPASKGNIVWFVTSPVQYAGTYLYKPLSSTLYANYLPLGALNAVGSYSPGEGNGECLQIGTPCTPTPITKGTLNGSPGTGDAI